MSTATSTSVFLYHSKHTKKLTMSVTVVGQLPGQVFKNRLLSKDRQVKASCKGKIRPGSSTKKRLILIPPLPRTQPTSHYSEDSQEHIDSHTNRNIMPHVQTVSTSNLPTPSIIRGAVERQLWYRGTSTFHCRINSLIPRTGWA